MPRQRRILEANRVYHAYNRRTDRQLLFPASHAYDEFLCLMQRGREHYDIRICTFSLMPTHWHQAIWVRDGDGPARVGGYLRWLSGCHARRFRLASATRGDGHVYQDRYKTRPVKDAAHYLVLMRYIEANPVAAGLVGRAEDWRWTGLAERLKDRRRIVTDGPVPLPSNWREIVNARGDGGETFDVELAV